MDRLIDYAERLMNFIQSEGANFNEETQLALGTFLQEILQFIQESNENPVDSLPPNNQTPQLDQGPYPSSNVNAFKYNPNSRELFVKFHGQNSADSGPTYKYDNVPKNIYDVFSRGGVAPTTSGQNQYHRWIRGVTPSLGAALYHLIRNGPYQYTRLT